MSIRKVVDYLSRPGLHDFLPDENESNNKVIPSSDQDISRATTGDRIDVFLYPVDRFMGMFVIICFLCGDCVGDVSLFSRVFFGYQYRDT